MSRKEVTTIKVECGESNNVKKRLGQFKLDNDCVTNSDAVDLALEKAKRYDEQEESRKQVV